MRPSPKTSFVGLYYVKGCIMLLGRLKCELEDRLRSLAKSKDTSLVHYLQVKLVDDAVRHTNCWYDHLISM